MTGPAQKYPKCSATPFVGCGASDSASLLYLLAESSNTTTPDAWIMLTWERPALVDAIDLYARINLNDNAGRSTTARVRLPLAMLEKHARAEVLAALECAFRILSSAPAPPKLSSRPAVARAQRRA